MNVMSERLFKHLAVRYGLSLLTAGCLYLFYTFALTDVYGVYRQAAQAAQRIPKETEELNQVNSGRDLLPEDVQLLLSAIDSSRIHDFNFYGTYGRENNPMSWFYLNASAWPARLDSTSVNVIGYTNEIKSIPAIKILYDQKGLGIGTLNK